MKINEIEIAEARQAWGEGLINISSTYDNEGIDKATTLANQTLDKLYGFEFGPILFKPTLSGGNQTFRNDKEGTLSYFIGQNSKYPSDTGFALKSWRECNSETSSLFIENDIAMWMGWVSLTNQNGEIVKVDKSWGYKRSSSGFLKIVLHHSSLPYQG
jgi:hypothetical protein|tara:strand:+ start:787 stop:1260 length:474 start_codon:yes stop_codon:yes gene_type:complete